MLYRAETVNVQFYAETSQNAATFRMHLTQIIGKFYHVYLTFVAKVKR